MAIDFKCTQCGKALSAQQQFAGRRITCPNCQFKMFIPLDVDLPAVPAAPPSPKLNEKQEITPDDAAESQSGMRPCPYCAEKIQSAARKCRYCHEYLDDDLRRADELRRRGLAIAAYRDAMDRNAMMWRSFSILATGFTYTWLIFENLSYIWRFAVPPSGKVVTLPWVLIIFNTLLAYGLMRLSRLMRVGPPSIFFAAAIAIFACGPLNVLLNTTHPEIPPDVAKEFLKDPKDLLLYALGANAVIALFFSLPAWYTGLKLKALERAAKRTKKP